MQSKQRMEHGWVRQTIRRMAALWMAAVVVCTGSVLADTYTWSINTTGVAADGSGTWNTTSANWVGVGDTHTAWNNANGSTAAFGAGGSAGTVTVDPGGVTVGGLTFNSGVTGMYTLSGGSLTLTGTPAFVVNADAAISSVMDGSAGLTKSGSGKLILNAANTYTGGTTIAAGTLALTGGDNRLSTNGTITLNSGVLDLGGGTQTLSGANFAFKGGVLQNGTVNFVTTQSGQWIPPGSANMTVGTDGGFVTKGRMLLAFNASQTLTLASGAGETRFGGNESGAANFINVDTASPSAVIVNGGVLNFTDAPSGAGYLRIGANGSPTTKPTGTLTVNNGVVNIGHSMNMGAIWNNSVVAAYGIATVNLSGGTVNIGTGSDTATSGGTRGWLYLGNANTGTVSRSTVNLNGGSLSLIQLEAGAYGTNAVNFNGGTLQARANNLTFVNGTNLTCNIGTNGAVIDTAGFAVGIAANLSSNSAAGGLVKRGTGTLLLSGSNTYCGVTAVELGTLKLSSTPGFANLKLRLDASDASTLFTNSNGSGAVTASGQPVGYWVDRSGNGKPAMQTSPNRRPTYITDATGFNGLPVLQFDGVDDEITSALDINATNIPNMTVVMVYRQVAKTNEAALWGHDNGEWDRMQLLDLSVYGAPDCDGISTSNGWATVKGMNTNVVLLYTAVLKNGVANGSAVYINGMSDSTNGLPSFTSWEGAGHTSFTLANIGRERGDFNGNVQVGEVFIFDTALGDDARHTVESYLKNKWMGTSDPLDLSVVGLPANGSVSVASGAVLDLDGGSQTLASLSGGGTVVKGCLTVTDTLAPGGTNTVGLLTLPIPTVLEGATLLSDVAMDGSCDQLVGSGDLSLEGLILQVANPGLLNTQKSYTLVTCSGTLSGSFAETHLPDAWHIRYDREAGAVTIYYSPRGTLIKLR